MAYVHCMPARVIVLRHGLDNIVSGTLRTHDGDVEFRTRGHIVKVTNKIYRNCPWKPSAGDAVLVDAEIGPGGAILDHIEPDIAAKAEKGSASPHLDAIAAMLPRHPVATKTLRVFRASGPVRLRFAACASRRDRRGQVQDEIVHAVYDDGAWSIWTVAKEGGRLASSGIDGPVLTIIARAAGSDMIASETERERSDRIERDEIAEGRMVREAAAALPFDDCPF